MTTTANPYPVDSTTRPCCGGIGGHSRDCQECTAGAAIEVLRRLAETRTDTTELAAHLDMSEPVLIGRLTGRTVFTVAELVNVGELLGCTLTDILTGALR